MKNIWVPISGQIAQQHKVETIANNIANANTAGFKKDQVVFKEHLTALSEKGADVIDLPRKEWSPDDFYRTQGAENAFVKVNGSHTNFQQGSLTPSSNPFDLALFGKGFFEVLTPNGVRYTRKGNFGLSKTGELVTEQGYKLLTKIPTVDEEGNKIEVSDSLVQPLKLPPGSKISISKAGEIFTQDGKVGDISVVEFKDPQALKKQGHSLFVNNATENTIRNGIKTSVNQGFVEESNVNAVREMSELINAHRHFENIQRAVKTYDQMSGQAVNDIADFN